MSEKLSVRLKRMVKKREQLKTYEIEEYILPEVLLLEKVKEDNEETIKDMNKILIDLERKLSLLEGKGEKC